MKYFFLNILFLVLVIPNLTHAAQITASSSRTQIHVGEEVLVDVLLDTQGQALNAISGTLRFDPQVLKFNSISRDNSIVNLWTDEPVVNNSFVRWGGLMPGGFLGVRSPFYQGSRPGQIIRLSFVALKEARTEISFPSLEVYLNDGKATLAEVSGENLDLNIISGQALSEFLPTLSPSTEVQSEKNHFPKSTNWDIIASILCLGLIVILFYIIRKWKK
jgi:hypothetical protein